MAVVPSSHTFQDGLAPSSEQNTYVRDPIFFLLNPPIAELRQATTQSIADSTWTSLTFDATDVDKNPSGTPGHSNSTNNSRYVAQYAGWHLVGGGYNPNISATGGRGTRWAVNGTAVNGSGLFLPASAAVGAGFPARTKRIFLNVGDYLELQGWQNSGAPLGTQVAADAASTMSIGFVSN